MCCIKMRSIVLFSSILLSLFCECFSSKSVIIDNVTLIVLGKSRFLQHLPETDENFVCATLDWWPQSKTDFNQHPWGKASILNLDLKNRILANAIKAFGRLRIRVGGSLQDQVVYQVGSYSKNCTSFKSNNMSTFGFSNGCLSMKRWNLLNKFFNENGVILTFGLNALMGKINNVNNLFEDKWNSTNAYDFMKYTANKGYKIDSYELGNELSGGGVGARVEAQQYGKDITLLKSIITELYNNLSSPPPKVLGPGGLNIDLEWYKEFLKNAGPNVVDALTYHFYNLGSGDSKSVIDVVLDPESVDKSSQMYQSIYNDLNISYTNIWVSESGGAYTSGSKNVSPSFANGFWYLNQLGLASMYNHKVFCRQTLIGGNYGLLDVHTFRPNPDYYSALLFNRLMGKVVLIAYHVGSNDTHLRVYAHCKKKATGITILLINMSNSTTFQVNIQNYTNTNDTREEYHLTAKNDEILSHEVLLNGELLHLTKSSDIPKMKPKHFDATTNMTIYPSSIVFATLKNFNASGCS